MYLGSPFTDDGSPSTAIKLHANKMCHVLKFVSFINRNNDIPFTIKKKVFVAVVTTSVLYGCTRNEDSDESQRPSVHVHH